MGFEEPPQPSSEGIGQDGPYAPSEEEEEEEGPSLWADQFMPSEEERLAHVKEMLVARNTLDHILLAAAASENAAGAALLSGPSSPPLPAAFLSPMPPPEPGLVRGWPTSMAEFKKRLASEMGPRLQEEDPSSSFHQALVKVFESSSPSPSPGPTAAKWSQGLRLALDQVPNEVWAEGMGQVHTVARSTRDMPPLWSYPAETLEGLVLHLEGLDGNTTAQELPWSDTQEVMATLRTAVQVMDRVLPLSVATDHANTILKAVAYCRQLDEGVIKATLNHLLHGDDQGPHPVAHLVPQKAYHVRVSFGIRRWTSSYFGLGFLVESYMRAVITNPEEGEETQQLATLLCGCGHGFPLRADTSGPGGDDEEFVEAAAAMDTVEGGQAQGVMASDCLTNTYLTLRVRMGEKKGREADDEIDGGGGASEGLEQDGFGAQRDDQERMMASSSPRHHAGATGSEGFVIDRDRPLLAEVYGWGENLCGCLGTKDEKARLEPSLLPLNAALSVMERVVMVAMSSRHALVLTLLGSVYSCGDGTDGALGHGDLYSHKQFRMVDTFATQDPPPLLVAVAAGADVLGTQSAAVDSEGSLYTWGFGPATGQRTAKPVQRPGRVEGLGQGLREDGVKAVVCGGAFTAALTHRGRVYTWGLWAHGRLGIGPPATHIDRYNRRRVHRYRVWPAPVEGSLSGEHVVQLAAGAGHCLALTQSGALYAWGRDDFGQLGIDAKVKPPFASVFEPERVVDLRELGDDKVATVATIGCGTFHSLALDTDGGLWTWGAAGAACLGHGDVIMVKVGEEARRTSGSTQRSKRKQEAHAHELPVLAEKPAWARPRRVKALTHVRVQSISGGSHHSAAVTDDGRLFLWGESMSVCRSFLKEEEEDDEEARSEGSDEDGEEELQARMDVEGVETPRQPSATWLPRLASKWVESVVCGGHTTVVVSSGERIAMTMGRQLYELVSQPAYLDQDEDDDRSVASQSYDTTLIVGGRVLRAHRLILARRSLTLRELIASEEWPGEGAVLELLLPDMRYDVARALVQFIYTDNLLFTLDFRSSLPAELLAAAETYHLPRLKAVCQCAILATSGEHGLHLHVSPPCRPVRRAAAAADMAYRIPRSVAPTDFGGCLGDATWADVKFVAGGRPIHAHRFILVHRSEYFNAMFRSGMREGCLSLPAPHQYQTTREGPTSTPTTRRAKAVDIVVPDSYESMVRFLLFIYSGTMPDRGNEAVLEDLIAADRYRLLELKELCESLVEVDKHNCLEALQVAEMYSAPRLREASLLYVVRHLHTVAASPAYRDFADRHPNLMEDIFDKIKATSPLTTAVAGQPPPPHDHKKKDSDDQEAFDPGPFPWLPIGGLVACGVLYSQIAGMVALGPLVPFVNISFALCLVAYVTWTMLWQ